MTGVCVNGVSGSDRWGHQVRNLLRGGDEQAAVAELPVEHVYPLSDQIAAGLNASPDVVAIGKMPEQQHGQ
jgi:hypothetical protein